MLKIYFPLLVISIFIFSCGENENKIPTNSFAPKVVPANGHVVPADSISPPVTIPAGIPEVVLAGKPEVVPTNTNIIIAGEPKVVVAGTPRVITPGQGTFLLPKTVPAIDSPFVAGIPEVVIAKDAYTKDQNPQNFSSFKKLQGLKHGNISSIIEDKSGNLWFGTYGGGVTKYDGKSFSHFTEKEGLSNNVVLSIIEDQFGNIWFGTEGGGVSKYDGKSFTHFTEKEGLSNNIVSSILEDKFGNLWFGTRGGGVSKYDGNRVEAIKDAEKKGETISKQTQQDLKRVNGKLVKSFTHFTDKEGLSNNEVLSILEDKSGNLWFCTEGGGVSKYDMKTFSNFTENEGLCNNFVRCILEDKFGNLWFGTKDGGVSKYDGKFFTNFTEKEGLSNNEVVSILEDKSGNLWFGTSGGGVSKYDGNRVDAIKAAEKKGDIISQQTQQDLKSENGKLVKSFTHFTDKEGLSNNDVRSILEDKSGNLWFGTNGGGVSKYDGKSFTHFTDKEGLSNNLVWSILEDKSGNFWFGTNGGGVSKYDGKSFTHFTEKEGLSNNGVLSILQDKSGNLWFGTGGGGVSKYDGKTFTHFTEKEGLGNNIVWSILEDKFGNLWFGTYGGGVSKYDGKSFTNFTVKEGLSNNIVKSILEDKNGNLWFGTEGGGVTKYDGKYFTHFTEKEGLSNNDVVSILEDKSGNLWFATGGGGVSKYDGKNFTYFTEKEGLSNNVVMSILEDRSGNLWFGTRFGLSKLTLNKLVEISNKIKTNSIKEEDIFFKNYTYEDGFLGIGCMSNSILQAKDGTIWIGTNDRLTAYHPPSQFQSTGKVMVDTIPPNIQLTSIALFNENIKWINLLTPSKVNSTLKTWKVKDSTLTLGNGVHVSNFEFDDVSKWYTLPENLSLAYNNNYLTFNFVGITMSQPKKVKYQYKLEGIDENWSAITNRTEAPYGNLPQGTYSFKVKAMNSDGYWSNEFNYTFTIRPPWWKTWWFRTISICTILFSVWYYIKSRERKLISEKEKLEKTVLERTAEVVAEKEEVEIQKHLVEEKQKEIIGSIHYAKRIQKSMLPTEKYIDKTLNRLKDK